MTDRTVRQILLLSADELEKLARDWVETRPGYVEVHRFGGANDKGRDVVGFVQANRHEGPWDNYQCKQFGKAVPLNEGILAVGKIFYWSLQKDFTLPRKFYFVAPKGLVGSLRKLVDNPTQFRDAVIAKWDEACASKITSKATVAMTPALETLIRGWSFSNVEHVSVDAMANDPAIKPLIAKHYDGDPGGYPSSKLPASVLPSEMPYITAMIEAYEERDSTKFADHAAVFGHSIHGADLKRHRERFFEADAFQRFYRDNTSPQLIEDFREDIHSGVIDRCNAPAADSLARVEAVMMQAASVQPAGILAKYAKVRVKQGVCHHFVNDGTLKWKKP